MNRADRIATAKRVASSDSLPAKKEPAPTHGVMQQDNEENSFIKRISKWSNRDRSNWTNDKRPSHRNLTIGAALSQGALQTKNDSDMSALKGLEDSLQAMDTYVRKGNQDEHTHAADVTETMSNVKDLLRIREQSKQRARDTVANHAHEHRPKGPMFQVDETPDSPGMYRPIKPFDPDNLESVRRHQQFLDRKDEERRQAERSEREMHNFHALPMPGHVPFSDPAAAVEALPRDSLGDLIGEPEPPCSRKEKKKTPSCQSAAPKDLKAFFLTEGDTAAHEASSGEESSGEESNDDDIDAELAELVQKEREIMRSYTRLSRQRDRAMQAAAALTSEPSVDSYTTPRGASAGNRPASRLLTPGSTPRPTSTDVLLREATGGSGPSILDLDQKEREVLFKLKKEQKIRELKRETELQTVRDVQRAPNIAQAQESWRRAKEEHNRETLRQMQHEEMKQKLADMQEEMRIMRLEQKVNELRKVSENKILKDKLRGLVRAGMAETSVGESPAKAKKKKRKRTASKDKPKHNGIEFAGDPSVFTAGTAAGPESSLAEESSLLGLMTNSMVQGSSGFDGLSSQGKDAPKRSNRNRLPPRGPSLSYSQFDARGSILEEEEEGPRPEFSAAVRADRSALDLLSEEPSYVEDKSKVPARQSFESRGGRRPRDQPPAISFSEQHVTAPHQESAITYEDEEDIEKDSSTRRLDPQESMFAIGKHPAAKGSTRHSNSPSTRLSNGTSSRDTTPTKRKGASSNASPSPYGVDLAAAYDERKHVDSVVRLDRRGSARVIAATELRDKDLFVKSPTRSRPKLREYSSPHRNIFDCNDTEKANRPMSPGPPTAGNRPGWSEAEPDVSELKRRGDLDSSNYLKESGALSRRSDTSGVRSSRASTDLYLSDSDSVISYDPRGMPQTLPTEAESPRPAKPLASNDKMPADAVLPAPIVKDTRYRHIDVYKRSVADADDESSGYTFVPRPSSAARHDTVARPGSAPRKAEPDTTGSQAEQLERLSSAQIGTGERFFDSSSTQDKGRFRVNDARDFHTKSMHRRPDTLDDGVTLLLGVRRMHNIGASDGGLAPSASQAGDFAVGDEEVITVLFDRAQFTEDRARAWWQLNKERILNISKFR